MSIFAKPEAQKHGNYGPGKQWFLVNSEQLEALIIQFSPEIRHDTNRMADMIRELVDTEREKAGLDKSGGKGAIHFNSSSHPKSPDFSGEIRISGKCYEVLAYISHNKKSINLTFKAL